MAWLLVLLGLPGSDLMYFGVLDSGSPITVATHSFVRLAGVDPVEDEPLMEVPLGLGSQFRRVPVFEIELRLLGLTDEEPVAWRLPAAAHSAWRLPFEVLLGQRGWFDTFTTTLGPDAFVVEPKDAFGARFGAAA